MAIYSVAMLGKLGAALMSGEANVITDLVEKKIEEWGKEALADVLGDLIPGAPIGRMMKALETGGASEFNRLRNQWLHDVTPAPGPGISRIAGVFDRARRRAARSQRAKMRTKWGRSEWATSRQNWLDSHWKHDWRSQPRDTATGRWLPGRLDYIQDSLRYPGKRPGRTLRKLRRIRRARRAAAKKAVRDVFKT